jgi:hypothetical protein
MLCSRISGFLYVKSYTVRKITLQNTSHQVILPWTRDIPPQIALLGNMKHSPEADRHGFRLKNSNDIGLLNSDLYLEIEIWSRCELPMLIFILFYFILFMFRYFEIFFHVS